MSQSSGKSVPGQYDPSQSGRLLRFPGSKLSFASFHPRAASAWRDALPDINKLSLNEELYRPKRVVIETTADGQSSWRFVPRAKCELGVEDEGVWPRIVDLCGDLVEFDQDLWDVYKLDPEYTCIVRPLPALTTITRNKGKSKASENDLASQFSEQLPPNATGAKRRYAVLSPDRQMPPLQTPSSKRPRYIEISDDDSESHSVSSYSDFGSSDEEDEVEDMIVDESSDRSKVNGQTNRARARSRSKLRDELETGRKARRERLASKLRRNGTSWGGFDGASEMVDLTRDGSIPPTSQQSQSHPRKPESVKRKVPTDYASGQGPNGVDTNGAQHDPRSFKRARTLSPTSIKRELAGKKAARKMEKKRKVESSRGMFTASRHSPFATNSVLPDVPEEQRDDDTNQSMEPFTEVEAHAPESQVNDDDEAARQTSIEVSRQKIAALEKDRPLWEQAVRERERKERAENEALEREQQRREEAERTARQRMERERLEQERREALAREAALRHEQEARVRRRRQQWERWSRGPWSSQRALERYRVLAEAFDNTKFSSDGEPLTFDAIPWPVLHSPVSFTVEDIDWSAVEKFFAEVRHHMRMQDYKEFVEKSHRRFHPDRWRGRRLFDAVVRETERGELEVAANTVAQAITPIWRELKGR
ncbi:hypothetical protein NEOLEDRAFT_1131729 [Neolentinus lepideus HHB14362 ss-1]|uniref:Uncharacterized protein n=1 Tax=Neolentinus lepideus HHB14362 ss-1 TaxID=1314782 RepID=A0A165TIP9_9AGAM|nr:hypothetical protein NEOLEDRAFT_1131729 [Neolentinus lepideus HHB14362 ss-1]